jgi:hypothetical protein
MSKRKHSEIDACLNEILGSCRDGFDLYLATEIAENMVAQRLRGKPKRVRDAVLEELIYRIGEVADELLCEQLAREENRSWR